MADETTGTFVDLLREQRGPLVRNIKRKQILLAELNWEDIQTRWDGKSVKVPIILNPLKGAQTGTETGTFANPEVLDTTSAFITTAQIQFAVSFSKQLIKQSRNPNDTSWAQVMPLKMQEAEKGIRALVSEMAVDTGVGLIAKFTAGATSATQTVGVDANWYRLYRGRKVDIRDFTTGAVVSAGRIITDFAPAAGTITFDSSVTVTTSHGIFILNTGTGANAALQGFDQIFATTGSFQQVNMANFPNWRGTDGRAGDTTTQDMTMNILDKAERYAEIYSGDRPDFYYGDQAVVDRHTQVMSTQARWAGDQVQLKSGFTGVAYRNKAIVGDLWPLAGTVYGVFRDDVKVYSVDDGPDWDDLTGNELQRFARTPVVEAWLDWYTQFAFHRLVAQTKIGNLARSL